MLKRYSEGIRLFGKEAIKDKGGSFQRELLEKAKSDGPDFVRWLDGKIAYCLHDSGMEVVEGDSEILLPSVERITAGQFLNPCPNDMVEWYNLWSAIPMSDASSFGFWGYVTRRMIENKKILPSYLVLKSGAKGGDGESAGKDEIDNALNSGPEEMDKCVRNFCRHLSGLFEARGTRSLYVDCCLATAWWKCHVSKSAGGENWQETALPIIREGGLWGNLGEKMATKLTVLGDVNIRDGIIQFLYSNEGDDYRGKNVVPLLLRVGARTSWCAMGIFTPEEVRQQVAEIAKKT